MSVSPQSTLTLACILLTILLDMVGLGIILPVLPQLIGELTGGSVAEAAVIGGYMVFFYSLMQFIFGPVLGNLSDQFGRRPILLISLVGLTVDQVHHCRIDRPQHLWRDWLGNLDSNQD